MQNLLQTGPSRLFPFDAISPYYDTTPRRNVSRSWKSKQHAHVFFSAERPFKVENLALKLVTSSDVLVRLHQQSRRVK